MELWFILALSSTLFAGIAAFLQKVVVEKGYDNVLFNTLSMLVSILPAYSIAALYNGDNNWLLAIGFGAVTGILYLLSTFARTAGMKDIDTALFFPLYKTFGPIVITIFGLLFFQEWFTFVELFGIGLGIVIPLLLIHKSEHSRQNNLKRGLLFMALTVLLTSTSTITSKLGSEILSSVFLFAGIANTIGGIAGLMMFYKKERKKPQEERVIVRVVLKDKFFILITVVSGLMGMGAFITLLQAYKLGGPLAIVYTINSFYILIPIILSIIIYKEHWNARKAFAIGLSVVALAFLH